MNMSTKTLAAGTIIQITNLKTKKNLNGKYGVVQKQLANKRYAILNDGESTLALKRENLKPVVQCPSERFPISKGLLIWPEVENCPPPCVQWLNDERLSNLFETKGCQFSKDAYETFDLLNSLRHVTRSHVWGIPDDYAIHQVLKKMFGWKKPGLVTVVRNFCYAIVWYDEASKAPANNWLDNVFNFKKCDEFVPEIRGSMVYLETKENNFLNEGMYPSDFKETSLNALKTTFQNMKKTTLKKHPINENCEKEASCKCKQKSHELRTKLPVCEKRCENCFSAQRYHKLGNALGEHYSMNEIFKLRREFDDYTKQQEPIFTDLEGMERFVKDLRKKAMKSEKHWAFLKISEVEFDMTSSVNREDDDVVFERFAHWF